MSPHLQFQRSNCYLLLLLLKELLSELLLPEEVLIIIFGVSNSANTGLEWRWNQLLLPPLIDLTNPLLIYHAYYRILPKRQLVPNTNLLTNN